MERYPARDLYRGATAARYDEERFTSRKGRWLDRREKRSVTKALKHVDRACTILDLPCGTGRITEHLLALGYRVAGADISAEMISHAESRIGDHERLIGFHHIDAASMPFPANAFDCVTSVRFMGHLPPSLKIDVLREMARVAKQYLVVTFYRGGAVQSLKWLLMHQSRMSKAAWHPVTHTDLRRLFCACGVTPVNHWRVYPLLSDAVTYLLRVGLS